MAVEDPKQRGATVLLVPDPFRAELEAIYNLHAAKRSDYTADSKDILANYRFAGKAIGVSVEAAMFSRLSEKYFRAMNVFNKGHAAVTEEKLEDTLRDLCIISLLIILSLKGEGCEGQEGES